MAVKIKKTKNGYTFSGLPNGYYLPTYEQAVQEYNYRKKQQNNQTSKKQNNQKINSSVTRGGAQIDPKNGRKYVIQIRKEVANKNGKITEYTSNGDKSINFNNGDLIVRTGKYYIDTKTFIPDQISIDPSYKDYSTNSNNYNSTQLQQTKPSNSSTSNQKHLVKNNRRSNNRVKSKTRVKSKASQYNIPQNDLSFISQYIQAYQNDDQKKIDALNIALAKNPNKNLIWKGIWPALDPSHTPEKSALDHKYLWTLHPGTRDEIGMTNWYNAFNGNTMAAEGSRTDGRYFDLISPEYRQWSVSTVNPDAVAVSSQDLTKQINLEDMIRQNADLFRSQYEYAKQHNGAFDYTPSSFDVSNLNVNYKYGGIGDFMDTYNLSPDQLYSTLEKFFVSKKQYGGTLIKKFQSGDKLIQNSINTLGMWNSRVTGQPYNGYIYTPESNAYVYKRQKAPVIEKPSQIKFSDFPLSVQAKTLWDYMMYKIGLNPSWEDKPFSSPEKLAKLAGYDRKLPKKSKNKQQKK